MDVVNSALVLFIRREHGLIVNLLNLPVCLIGHRILGKLLEIPGLHQVIERLRSFLFIQRVLRDQVAQGKKILAQYRFPRLFDRV